MVVAGDRDHRLPRRDPPLPNVGAEKAGEAAEAIGAALLLLPVFAPDEPGSDFNDLAAWAGPGHLARLVFGVVRGAPEAARAPA